MRKIHLLAVLVSALLIQPVFADDEMASSNSTACRTIAKACLKAGYTRISKADHRFWADCMKPAILGKTVKGLKLDAGTATTCRTDKIAELKQELSEFESVSTN